MSSVVVDGHGLGVEHYGERKTANEWPQQRSTVSHCRRMADPGYFCHTRMVLTVGFSPNSTRRSIAAPAT